MKNINIILFTVLTIAYLIYAYFLKISYSTDSTHYLFWRIFIYDNRSFYYYEWKIKGG